jgi:hypothetical protein
MSLSRWCERSSLDRSLLRCNFVRTRNVSELLWTSIAHLLLMLKKEYEWTALGSHSPFVISIEQGIRENCFGQSSSICYVLLNKEYEWTVLDNRHLLSVLDKEYEWTALGNHRPFFICLEQGIWMNCFGQSSSICCQSWTRNMNELLWTVIVRL